MKDYLDPINSIDMPEKADSNFALDFLLSAKNGARNCAFALTEAATPQVRTILRNQLETALNLRREIADYMMSKNYLRPYHVKEQFQLDIKSAKNAVDIAGMSLFPGDTDRLGTFATLDKTN